MRGAFAGTVATVPMSVVMLAGRRMGLVGEAPPETITATLLDRGGVHRSAKEQDTLAVGLHIAFGAGAGAVFGPISRRVPIAPIPLGIAYGTGIWAVSYMGWIPWAGLMPAAQHDRRDRQAVMLAGHVVYGAALGALMRRKRTADTAGDAEPSTAGAAEEQR
jgi:hypothetical protein